MKHITILIAMLLLCGTAAANMPDADHYMIVVLVWDNETGEAEAGVPVTFGGMHTFYTELDGSIVYDTANLDNIEHGSMVEVECKYGTSNVPIILHTCTSAYNETSQQHEWKWIREWGTAVTFNEPDEATVIEILAAMGIIATSLGGGIYLLRKRKKIIEQEDTMTENKEEWKLKRDFGVRALIATLTVLGYIGVTGLAVYKGDMNMLESISVVFLPIVMAMIVFYFNGSAIRDAVYK